MRSPIPADKRVVVTAGGQGIGRAIADAFLAAGAHVHVADLAAGPGVDTAADLSVEADVSRLFDDIDTRLGGLDVLINNVGIAGPTGPMESLTLDDWHQTMAVNVAGHFLPTREAIPRLRAAGGGSVISISSTAGTWGYPNRTPYAASKWAVVGMTKSLAMELGDDNIRVNCITPGSISGPRMDAVIDAEAQATGEDPDVIRQGYADAASMRTFIDTEDIAAMACWLASDAARLVSGQIVAVDGSTETLRTSR